MAMADIDRIFLEATISAEHTTSTHVYSMIIANCCAHVPVQEVALISTNNRFLQHGDNQFLATNVMKMLNFFRVSLLQIVADGNTRFRLLVACYVSSST